MNELQTIWVAVCVGLVFFMQAGFALLESGASRAKNSINVVMKNYTDMCLGTLIFWAIGYGLMFGDSLFGIVGSSHFFPSSMPASEAVTLAYQTMFAATAATIVSGAIAERMHFGAYLAFSVLVTAIIYPLFGSWAWNPDGWLAKLGFVDFAGATVVHSIGGWCALAGVIALGPRLGRYGLDGSPRTIPGHNLTLVAMGGFILWLGWFGFNGGSIASLESDNLGSVIFNTHLGGSAGVAGALLLMWLRKKPILMTTTVNGSIAGLVSITAGAAYFSPIFALLSGLTGGMLYALSVQWFDRWKLDDVVGAVSVHGVCGAWGTLAVALFPEKGFSIDLLFSQFIGISTAFLWAFPVAFAFFKLLDKLIGIRASTLHEQRGLDYTEHYELGYPEFQKSLHDGVTE